MKLVTTYGGHSIGVYNGETDDKAKVYKMMRDGRIKYFAPMDYSDQASSHEEREKTDLIIELENSRSFAGTHSVISKLLEISNRTNEQKNDLCEIALRNSQILYILREVRPHGRFF